MKKLLILMVILFCQASAYSHELEIINLKHRSAEELLPVIQPLLERDETASGMNYQLILRASPRNIAQIKRLLEGIDTPPRRLTVTVMQDVDSDTVSRLTGLSGSIGHLNARIISTRQLEDDKKTQQLQVLEGSRARVSTGQNVALPQRQVVQTPWGTQVVETMQYRDVSSGFYVLPRVHGDQVTVELSAQNDALTGSGNGYPTTRIQNTTSMVSGRLGEWLVVGGLSQQASRDNSTITTRSSSHSDEQRTVLIKVEEVN